MRTVRAILLSVGLALAAAGTVSAKRPRLAGLRLLILGGGTHTTHKFRDNSALLVAALRADGTLDSADYTEDLDALRSEKLADYDALLIYAWRATGHGGSIETDAQRAGLANFLRNGKGMVVAHIGVGCFDDWPEYGKMIGARWVSGTSSHSPYMPVEIKVNLPGRDAAGGVGDFYTVDEIYTHLVLDPSVRKLQPLFTADYAGERHPLTWQRRYGKGRVFVNVLGHGSDSWHAGGFQRLMRGGLLWATRH